MIASSRLRFALVPAFLGALSLTPAMALVLGPAYQFRSDGDGAFPNSALIADGHGSFYGTTAAGGAGSDATGNGSGTLFKWTPGGPATVIYKFCSLGECSDGRSPGGSLAIDEEGSIYGTTQEGGAPLPIGSGPGGCGIAYKLTPPSGSETRWTYAILHRFCSSPEDGKAPYTGVILSGGALFGATLFTNSEPGSPQIFKLAPPAANHGRWTYSTVANFDLNDTPSALTAGPSGALYGASSLTSLYGQTGPGSFGYIFALTPPAPGEGSWTKSTIYTFQGGDDASNNAGTATLTFQDGAITGTAPGPGNGSIFRWNEPRGWLSCALSPSTCGEAVIHRFAGGAAGSRPTGAVVAGKATYVTATRGGGKDSGVIVRVSPEFDCPSLLRLCYPFFRWVGTPVYSFTGGNDGTGPNALIAGPPGVFYGTTVQGAKGFGAVFELHE
jgi:uncharacterized repeat protein (TIGR03803 family)